MHAGGSSTIRGQAKGLVEAAAGIGGKELLPAGSAAPALGRQTDDAAPARVEFDRLGRQPNLRRAAQRTFCEGAFGSEFPACSPVIHGRTIARLQWNAS